MLQQATSAQFYPPLHKSASNEHSFNIHSLNIHSLNIHSVQRGRACSHIVQHTLHNHEFSNYFATVPLPLPLQHQHSKNLPPPPPHIISQHPFFCSFGKKPNSPFLTISVSLSPTSCALGRFSYALSQHCSTNYATGSGTNLGISGLNPCIIIYAKLSSPSSCAVMLL